MSSGRCSSNKWAPEKSNEGLNITESKEMTAGELLLDMEGWPTVKQDSEVTLEDILAETTGMTSSLKLASTDAVDSSVIDPIIEKSGAKLALSLEDVEEDLVYKMSSPKRGCFLIFNQINFDPHLKLRDREASRKDASNLKEMLEKDMKFKYIKILENLKKQQIFDMLRMMAEASHREYDVFGCAFLSHGESDGILFAKNESFNLSHIYAMFTADKCKSLAGKPKIFLIQACRGSKLDKGLDMTKVSYSYNEPSSLSRLPVEADFLFAYSSVPDYVSWINDENGSWFFQAFCLCFRKYHKKFDLMKILTKVNRVVATKCETNGGMKQMPCFTSTLTAELYF